jgi:sugar phosphate isomerase/epimerase
MNFKIRVTTVLTLLVISLIFLSCETQKKDKEIKQEISKEMVNLDKPFFKLSLAQWSLHKAVLNDSHDPINFAQKANELGFEGVEYVSTLYKNHISKIGIDSLVNILNAKSQKFNVVNVLIMIDDEGSLASTNEEERNTTVENHYKWVDAAKALGCHSIRVNAHGEGTAEEVSKAAVIGLTKLSEYAASRGINIIVENHGGYTSNGAWLANVIKEVNMPNCGTLPDFGNFCQTKGYGSINSDKCDDPYDVYLGVEELMPYAKAVSAKSYDFDEHGNQPYLDYERILQIVKNANYHGFIGVEYEGENLEEIAGIIATKKLILKAAKKINYTNQTN